MRSLRTARCSAGSNPMTITCARAASSLDFMLAIFTRWLSQNS